MKKTILLISTLFYSFMLLGQQFYETKIFNPKIKTLQIYPEENSMGVPILSIETDKKIVVSFDDMDFSIKQFYYKIVHCNRNWQKSSLSDMEYFNGFTSNIVEETNLSQNTTTLYTNYRIEIPSGSNSFKASGNYVLLISESNNFDKPDATACFYVYEQNVKISAELMANTAIGFNTFYQQLDIQIDNSDFLIQNPIADLNLFVFQNRRTDNAALDLKPTFTTTYKQTYNNNKKLIFEGGNTYRFIDFSDEYNYSGQIDKIEINPRYYSVFTVPAYKRNNQYLPSEIGNANGRYIINRKTYNPINYNADYMWVNFILPHELDFSNYNIYLLGDMFYNKLDTNSKMELSTENNIYYKSVFLKQGGCSFLYAFVPKKCRGKCLVSFLPFEGSYWQTQNEYTIFLYYTPFGAKYDKLIGFKTIK